MTDSAHIYISAKTPVVSKMPHFALTGSVGFDLYEKTDDGHRHRNSFIPPFNVTDGFENMVSLVDKKEREITINFPTYNRVSELYIGLDEGSSLLPAPEYTNKNKIVYYGSSITQGGCCSRPGNTYQAIISRRFDCDYLNLGFSGSALAEDEMIEYIKNLPMSVFVYDYDHNAPTYEHLLATHEKMFKEIREKNPELPIIILPRPRYTLVTNDEVNRFKVIKKTYENALRNGDKNVYFLSGKELMAIAKDDGRVDTAHPNNLGFFSMAVALGDLLEKII